MSAEPSLTAADVLVRRLADAGVDRVFGVPGEHCLTIVDAIERHAGVDFVSTRHEGGAAMMAEAYGKFTGNLSVCLGTASVGGVNLLSGVNVASHDSTPMVAVVGQVETHLRGRGCWQEVDLTAMFAPLCRDVTELADALTVDQQLLRTMARARASRPGPVLVSFPADVQDHPAAMLDQRECTSPMPGPAASDLAAALELLRAAERPAIIAGGGVRQAGACAELVEVAELLGAPVLTAFRRTDAFPNTHPHYVGSLAVSSAVEVSECVEAADLLLVVGSRMSEITAQRYTVPRRHQTVVHVDVDAGGMAASWFDADVRLVSDAREALQTLAKGLDADDRRTMWWASWDDVRSARRARASSHSPEQALIFSIAEILDRRLPPDAVIASDAGDFFIAAGVAFAVGGNRRYLGPTSGSMGYGVPAAIAAKLAAPDRTSVALCGDGGAMMTIQELETASRYSAPIILVVFNNNCYGSIRRHQDTKYGGRRSGVTLTNPDFSALGRLFGLDGSVATDADEFVAALDRALSRPQRGHVIEVRL